MTDPALPAVGAPPGTPTAVEIFDTTLRDGAQFEGISLSVEDKLRVAEQLDWLGVAWIEGGYPMANPKDEEFFRRAVDELRLSTATLVARLAPKATSTMRSTPLAAPVKSCSLRPTSSVR
jgi:isopropylmalate/homocitrate/citramalate synthase